MASTRRVTLLALGLGVCRGQFLQPSAGAVVASSWISSESWVAGRDGSMHEQVHEVKTETVHNFNGEPVKHTESHLACKDGLCQETVSVEKPGSLTFMSQQAPGSVRPSMLRLRQMLSSFSFPIVYVEERPHPVNVNAKFLAPRPVSAVEPTNMEKAKRGALLAGASLALIALILGYVAKCKQEASVREVQSLAEPLAAAGAVQGGRVSSRREAKAALRAQTAAPQVEEKATPVGAYLERVYGRAVLATEKAASQIYLQRVYEQAASA